MSVITGGMTQRIRRSARASIVVGAWCSVSAIVGCDPGSEAVQGSGGGSSAGASVSSSGATHSDSGSSGTSSTAAGIPSASAGIGTSGAGEGGLEGLGGTSGGSGAATTGASQGGTPATGGEPSTGGTDGAFTLSWQDDFDKLDEAAWELENFTYAGNQAVFTPSNASVANSKLSLSLTAAPSGSEKPYLGVEMRSLKTITYGKISARMRFAKGSGVVSGLVLFYTPFPNCDWNEIDVEHLGKTSNSSQLNAMVYLGAQNPNCTTSVSPTQDPLVTDLGFDAEADFHVYDIEWTPAGVKYFADGVLLRNWTKNIAFLKRPQNILLTIWASSSATWAGPIGASSAPTTAELDWIKVYNWNG